MPEAATKKSDSETEELRAQVARLTRQVEQLQRHVHRTDRMGLNYVDVPMIIKNDSFKALSEE